MAFRHQGAVRALTKDDFTPNTASVDLVEITNNPTLLHGINLFVTTSFPGSPFVDMLVRHDPSSGGGVTRNFSGTVFFEGDPAGQHTFFGTPAGVTQGEDVISTQNHPQWWCSVGMLECLGAVGTTGQLEFHIHYQECEDDTTLTVQ